MKNKRGITLIALVITIVVLIILAAVAINLSLGNNGIFNRAKTAKEQYSNAQIHEETEITKYSNQIVDNATRGQILIDEEEYNKLKLINKPNLWEANTKEYDFGDGIYGRRFVGTITVKAKSTRADITLLNTPIKTILNAGGCVNYVNGDSDRGLYLGYGIQTYQSNNGYYCGIFSENGTGNVVLSVSTSASITFPANLPYDVWITYTK